MRHLFALGAVLLMALVCGTSAASAVAPPTVLHVHIRRLAELSEPSGELVFEGPTAASGPRTAGIWDARTGATVKLHIPAACFGQTPVFGAGTVFYLCEQRNIQTGWIFSLSEHSWMQIPAGALGSCGGDQAASEDYQSCGVNAAGSQWVDWAVYEDCHECDLTVVYFNFHTGAVRTGPEDGGDDTGGDCRLLPDCEVTVLSHASLSYTPHPCAPVSPTLPYEPVGPWVTLQPPAPDYGSNDPLYLERCGSAARTRLSNDIFGAAAEWPLVIWQPFFPPTPRFEVLNLKTGRHFTLELSGPEVGGDGFQIDALVGRRMYVEEGVYYDDAVGTLPQALYAAAPRGRSHRPAVITATTSRRAGVTPSPARAPRWPAAPPRCRAGCR